MAEQFFKETGNENIIDTIALATVTPESVPCALSMLIGISNIVKRFINTGSARHWIMAPHLNCQIIRLFIITFCRVDQLAIKLYSLQPITSGLVIYKPIVTLITVVPLKAYPEVQLNGEKRFSQ